MGRYGNGQLGIERLITESNHASEHYTPERSSGKAAPGRLTPEGGGRVPDQAPPQNLVPTDLQRIKCAVDPTLRQVIQYIPLANAMEQR